MKKAEKYEELLKRIRSITASGDTIADMANSAALIHGEFNFWWTGFYRVIGENLVLGPFQGPVACTSIPFGRGVCGTAWKRRETVVVPDVEEFPGHIACSSESRSEIVVPVWSKGEIVAVLDIDSEKKDTFDATDAKYLEMICAEMSCAIDRELRDYVEEMIIPRYDGFDKGHGRDHAWQVISQALQLAVRYDVKPDMVFAAAAYHDTGLCGSREEHHTLSAGIIRADMELGRWFTSEEIDIIADAAEDHRASSGREPRTIYGKIIAEADRLIDPYKVILRTIQFGLAHYPQTGKEGQWERTLEHLHEKYADGGYLKLWIPESPNAGRLAELRETIKDEVKLRAIFEDIYSEITDK